MNKSLFLRLSCFIFVAFSCVTLATTFVSKNVKCGNCGVEVKVNELVSTSHLGPMDLDTRPAPLAREAYLSALQSCPQCGYCASDLSRKVLKKESREYLATHQKEILSAIEKHDGAYRHHTAASIAAIENPPNLPQAMWLELSAAWECDDRNDNANAVQYRKNTLEYLQKHLQRKEVPHLLLLQCDLLRRIRQFDEAQKVME